jgi:hypothetical protein
VNTSEASAANFQNIPELSFPVPLVIDMKNTNDRGNNMNTPIDLIMRNVSLRDLLNRSRRRRRFVLIPLLFGCFALSPAAQAVVPAPDGGYPNGNTAEGQNALLSLTTGINNTAVGFFSLKSDLTGSYNTAIGPGALFANRADQNTATGFGALLSNTTGSQNTANGTLALLYNTVGPYNTALGASSLQNNHTGLSNTAAGYQALYSNDSTGTGLGSYNSAFGAFALVNNTDGESNSALGTGAMEFNQTGQDNVAVGTDALIYNLTGNGNTAIGGDALEDSLGSGNIALGAAAGLNISSGDNNIIIGNSGVDAESNTIRIGTVVAGIQGAHTAAYIAGISGTAVVGDAVVVDENGQLGTATSSQRFKKTIRPMDKTSEAILALQPVSFQYKSDSKGTPRFGLIAEDVAKVNPDLVVRHRNGEIYSVRYEAVNAMLLNEFLKEHRKVESLENAIADQQRENVAIRAMLKEQAAQIQKVSAQLEVSKPAPQTVLNNH